MGRVVQMRFQDECRLITRDATQEFDEESEIFRAGRRTSNRREPDAVAGTVLFPRYLPSEEKGW